MRCARSWSGENMVETIRRYIDGEDGSVAFRCRSKKEVSWLFNIVKDVVHQSYHYYLDQQGQLFGSYFYEKEICYRLERANGKLDWGHSHAEFYVDRGRKIIDVCGLLTQQDYGEFETGFSSISDAINGILV